MRLSLNLQSKMLQHKDLNQKKWQKLDLLEQLANIGSEVIRAINWEKKQNTEYARLACNRAVELFDLTLSCQKSEPALKEVARARELWLDYFVGSNQYEQTGSSWEKYFMAFTLAAQIRRRWNQRPYPKLC